MHVFLGRLKKSIDIKNVVLDWWKEGVGLSKPATPRLPSPCSINKLDEYFYKNGLITKYGIATPGGTLAARYFNGSLSIGRVNVIIPFFTSW